MDLVRTLRVAAALALWAVSVGAQESAPSSEPWGYLYVLRTQQLFPLTSDEARVGRLTENDVVLTSPRVSRRHAVVRRSDEGVEVVDVGSSNGTELNGRPLRARLPAALAPGDRVAFADETLLYHRTLAELWPDELANRLLSGIIKLKLRLPQDGTRKSFGREETVPAVTEAQVSLEKGSVESEYSSPLESGKGFPEGVGAFVGNVKADGGVLRLSLWAIEAGESMTSRRSSFTNLKHTSLEVSVVEKAGDGTEDGGARGPWFSPEITGLVFDVFDDEPEYSLRFANALAIQPGGSALEDAAATLAFRHRLEPDEWKLLALAAHTRGLWVESEIDAKGLSLTDAEKTSLSAALDEGRAWLGRARDLGASREAGDDAKAVLDRASERLTRLSGNPE